MNLNSSSSSNNSSSNSGNNSSTVNSRRSGAASCVICSDHYKSTDDIYAGTCGHVFHWDCLQRWWEESRMCPICRETDSDYFKIYLDFEDSYNGRQDSQQPPNDSEFENLLYEARLYRDEIEYLNSIISKLRVTPEVDSDSISD